MTPLNRHRLDDSDVDAEFQCEDAFQKHPKQVAATMSHSKRGRSTSSSTESRAVVQRTQPGNGDTLYRDTHRQLVGFGKHKWLTFQDLAEHHHDYSSWILEHKSPSDQMRRLQAYLRQHPAYTAVATSRASTCSTQAINGSLDSALPAWVQRILEKGETTSARQGSATPAWHAIKPEKVKSLHKYQREAIEFGVKRGGRVLLGDEMGLGKTIQALAIAATYVEDWPVLVVAPGPLRLVWQAEIRAWLSHASTQVVTEGTAELKPSCNIFVVSYDLIARCKHLRQPPIGGEFQVVICDESHYLKNIESARAQVLVPMLQRAKRAILLSGTPMLNGTFEIYPQLDALLPNTIPAPKAFAQRYCITEEGPMFGTKYTGTFRPRELNKLLATVMIRRQKADVLKELPPKRWRVVPVEVSSTTADNKSLSWSGDAEEAYKGMCTYFTRAWEAVGRAKIDFTAEYTALLLDGLPATEKVLVFAHHHVVVDGLEDRLRSLNQGGDVLVKIDGRTSQVQRQENVRRFQEDPRIRVALLSIRSCGHGLTLTAASAVVFAELFCVPAVMMQAEDRAHRIGQQRCVDICYMVAHHTVDDTIMKHLERKRADICDVLPTPSTKVSDKEVLAEPLPHAKGEVVAQLVAMGFDADRASAAVQKSGGRLDDALDHLQNMPSVPSRNKDDTPCTVSESHDLAAAQLMAMGFDLSAASAALKSTGGVIDAALELLLKSGI